MNEYGQTTSGQLADRLCQCLRRYFDEVAPRQHGIWVRIAANASVLQRGEAAEARSLQLQLPGCALRIDGRLTVKHFGGNVYDVVVRLACAGERRFSLCLPCDPITVTELQTCADAVCSHVLEVLEREAGRWFLRIVNPGLSGSSAGDRRRYLHEAAL